jgi:flagellar biosynthetic protein FlhB
LADDVGLEDRTEEATPERREEFRERGQVVVSRELTSVMVLAGVVVFFSSWSSTMVSGLERLFVTNFEQMGSRRLDGEGFLTFLTGAWAQFLWIIIPVFLVVFVVATAGTFAQTRMNWSWKRVSVDFSRLNPVSGLARMVNMQAAMELGKSVAKLAAIGVVAWLILYGEMSHAPELMSWPIVATWRRWAEVTKTLFWGVAGLLLFVAVVDYLYNFFSFERRIKMTKQEVKEEFKRREVDPHVKGKMRRMARDLALKKTIAATRKATVLITNPTHYSIALRYEVGDRAPTLLAKGVDVIALEMRTVAREERIPIIENRPLARALYAQVKEGEEIPDKFYRAVAEIVRYVFKLKGRKIPVKPAKAAPGAGAKAAAAPSAPDVQL